MVFAPTYFGLAAAVLSESCVARNSARQSHLSGTRGDLPHSRPFDCHLLCLTPARRADQAR